MRRRVGCRYVGTFSGSEVGSVADVGDGEDETGEGGDVKRACQAGRSVAAIKENIVVEAWFVVWNGGEGDRWSVYSG